MEQEFSLLIVFAAGLLSFLSPWVLSLIPGYIAFVKMSTIVLEMIYFAMPVPRVVGHYHVTATDSGSYSGPHTGE